MRALKGILKKDVLAVYCPLVVAALREVAGNPCGHLLPYIESRFVVTLRGLLGTKFV